MQAEADPNLFLIRQGAVVTPPAAPGRLPEYRRWAVPAGVGAQEPEAAVAIR